jgi:predicted nucleic acid-binding protein
MKFVIDTNVPVAANGRDTHANLACQLACVRFLQAVASDRSNNQIVVDEYGLILDEYNSHLHFKGQPGVGDMFFKYLHDRMYDGAKVQVAAITPIDDDTRGFDELPVNQLDSSDRKFLATALSAGAEIVNSLDTDWHCQRVFVAGLNVAVRQLCPDHGCDDSKC